MAPDPYAYRMARVRKSAQHITHDDAVNDPELHDEIELVALLVAAARRCTRHLTKSEIDRALQLHKPFTPASF